MPVAFDAIPVYILEVGMIALLFLGVVHDTLIPYPPIAMNETQETDVAKVVLVSPMDLWNGTIMDPDSGLSLVSFDSDLLTYERAVGARLNPAIAYTFIDKEADTSEAAIRSRLEARKTDPSTAMFEIRDRDGAYLGEVELLEIHAGRKEAYIGVAIAHTDHQQQGIGTKAVHMLLSHAKTCGMNRVFAAVDGNNDASVKLFGRLPVTVHQFDEDDHNMLDMEIHLDQWEPDVDVKWIPRSI